MKKKRYSTSPIQYYLHPTFRSTTIAYRLQSKKDTLIHKDNYLVVLNEFIPVSGDNVNNFVNKVNSMYLKFGFPSDLITMNNKHWKNVVNKTLGI